mmetsp:Transcript_33572/g.105733  ORF Transcript_33572/g.105733 Transcript_33572/m.105733 type:complete len:217 (+) Transcript_33572:326-976(+)
MTREQSLLKFLHVPELFRLLEPSLDRAVLPLRRGPREDRGGQVSDDPLEEVLLPVLLGGARAALFHGGVPQRAHGRQVVSPAAPFLLTTRHRLLRASELIVVLHAVGGARVRVEVVLQQRVVLQQGIVNLLPYQIPDARAFKDLVRVSMRIPQRLVVQESSLTAICHLIRAVILRQAIQHIVSLCRRTGIELFCADGTVCAKAASVVAHRSAITLY